MSFSELPAPEITLQQVIDVIIRTEKRHRVVWTAGRVLKEGGLLHRVATGDPAARKLILRRVRRILKTLACNGVLVERGLQFNYGTTTEVSYDFVGHLHQKNQVFSQLNDQSHDNIIKSNKSVPRHDVR